MEEGTYALFTKTSISLHSSGNLSISPSTSSSFVTSIFHTSTWQILFVSDSIVDLSSCSEDSLLAVRINRQSGAVRANSRAVDRPIPAEAPVMRMVFFERRRAIADDIVESWSLRKLGLLKKGETADCSRRWGVRVREMDCSGGRRKRRVKEFMDYLLAIEQIRGVLERV